jgi:hypothetical protein
MLDVARRRHGEIAGRLRLWSKRRCDYPIDFIREMHIILDQKQCGLDSFPDPP